MCTTSFPSRSIESFCLLFSSFYDLTPKGAAKGRENQNAPISRGEKYGNAGKGKRLPGSLATWRDREIGGGGGV